MTTRDAYNLPEDLTEVSSALDRLGEADGARDGLEDRVFEASRSSLPAPPTYRFEARENPGSSFTSLLAPLRLAAAVALIGGVAVVWLALRPTAPQAPPVEVAALEQTVDDWMELSSVFEDDLSGDIDSLASATNDVDLDAWTVELIESDEGSM